MWPRLRIYYAEDDGAGGGGNLALGEGEGEPAPAAAGSPPDPAPAPEPKAEPTGGEPTPEEPQLRDWQGELESDDLKTSKALARYESPEAAYQALLDTQKELHSRPAAGAIQVPGDDATPEQQAAYRAAIGVPEAADGYDLKVAIETDPDKEGYIEGLGINDEQLKGFAQQAHALGLTPAQAQALVDYDTSRQKEAIVTNARAETAALEQSMKDLETIFGEELKPSLKAVPIVRARYGQPDKGDNGDWFATLMRQKTFPAGVGNDPKMVRLLVAVGQAGNDHRFVDGEGPTGGDKELTGGFSYGAAGEPVKAAVG